MAPMLLAALFFHTVIPAVRANFLESVEQQAGSAADTVGGAVGSAADGVGSAASEVGGAVGGAANEVGGAVGGAANEVGGAVAGAAGEVERAAADKALQQTGKCEMLLREQSKIEPTISPIIARGLLVSAEDPSADASACRARAIDAVRGEMDRKWHDPSGVSDKIVGGLFGELASYVCRPPLMSTLRAQEATRKSDPRAYREAVQETLRKSVFSDAWVQDLLADHCGGPRAAEPGLAATRLFAASWPLRAASWSQASLATSLSTAALVAALLVALLAAAARRRRRRLGAWAPALLVSGAGGGNTGEASEEDSDLIE